MNRAAFTPQGTIRESALVRFRARACSSAATALAAPVAAKPATGPSRYFTGADLFNLEVATDPQISPDGRTIAYVRKSNDIMTDRARSTIWLVDVATGQQRPLARRLGLLFLAALVARRHAARLRRRRRRQRRSSTCAGWRAAKARASPACPTARAASPGRRTAAASLIRCSFPTKARSSAQAPPKPEGAKWADPLQVIDAVTYRADGAGYLKPGYSRSSGCPPTAARRPS